MIDSRVGKEAREHGTPFLGVKQSSPNLLSANASNATDVRFSKEALLQFLLFLVSVLRPKIVRQKLERELPSDYCADYVFDIIKERIGFTEGVKVYYTNASTIHDREELVPLDTTVESGRRTLLNLAGGRSTLTFVATKPGVHVFKD
ncbi:unnamed protein product [Strongylus vulgaris]|uniref:Uncharacterized protein n=1 Tax=Strongylus vulgaris TaxID=40348 RepID=A0A3P7HYJ2_STRVU|nr:unnamed protein product [Strongylus vulgaris]